MGFFDALFGRTRVPSGKTDQIFAMSTAILDIATKLNAPFSGRAALVLRSVDNSGYEAIEREIKEVLALGGKDLPVKTRSHSDHIGFHWLVFEGRDADDVLNALHLTGDMVKEAGYGDSLLAAMFAFDPSWYFIYSYRRAAFYPFVPRSQTAKTRDQAREFRIAETLKPSLPIEKDPERWYALWDPPLDA